MPLLIPFQLIPVNQFLEHYAETFDELVGAWVIIEVEDSRWVFKWRLEVGPSPASTCPPSIRPSLVCFDQLVPLLIWTYAGLVSGTINTGTSLRFLRVFPRNAPPRSASSALRQ